MKIAKFVIAAGVILVCTAAVLHVDGATVGGVLGNGVAQLGALLRGILTGLTPSGAVG